MFLCPCSFCQFYHLPCCIWNISQVKKQGKIVFLITFYRTLYCNLTGLIVETIWIFNFVAVKNISLNSVYDFFKLNIWNALVGTIKGNKNLQLQRISRVSKLCLLNAALTGVQKAIENKVCLCGCCFIYLFKLKVVRFFSFGQTVKFILSLGQAFLHIQLSLTHQQWKIFLFGSWGKINVFSYTDLCS